MKKKRFIFIVIMVSAAFLSCAEGEDFSPTGKDYILITSVQPAADLVDGFSYEFSVHVEYELASQSQAELMIGFNTTSIGSYAMFPAAGEIVSKGRRRTTLYATVVAKDWGTDGDFKVYVNLSPYPRGSSWVPITNDTFELTF